MIIKYGEDFLQDACICYFYCKQQEYFYLLKNGGDELFFRHAHNELAKEVEIDFGSNLFVDSLVNIIVLIWRLALSFLEVFVEFAAVFEKEMEYFTYWIVYFSNICISFRHWRVGKGVWPHKHAFQNVDNFYLQFRIWNFLIDGQKDV